MNNYQKNKAKAKEAAINWQSEIADKNLSYNELAKAGEYFNTLGKRYGLLREFRANVIPC